MAFHRAMSIIMLLAELGRATAAATRMPLIPGYLLATPRSSSSGNS